MDKGFLLFFQDFGFLISLVAILIIMDKGFLHDSIYDQAKKLEVAILIIMDKGFLLFQQR